MPFYALIASWRLKKLLHYAEDCVELFGCGNALVLKKKVYRSLIKACGREVRLLY